MQPETYYVDRAMAPTRFVLALIGMFAGLAAALAAIGLYGVLSSMVRQRVPEIGIRMAFGAQPANVFRLIIGRGLWFAGIGLTIGLAGGLALTRMMARLLVSVTSWDPATYAATLAVFLGIAALACWIPARRAAAVEPNVALREE
jgi:putative ABC transport system permease protein